MTMGAATPWSIPTEYRGFMFRSRFEADFALALDEWDVTWEYEAKSFLLSNGQHYWPDFWLPLVGAWVELRGYRSAASEEQLARFALELPSDRAFYVVRPRLSTTLHVGRDWVRAVTQRASLDRKELQLLQRALLEFRQRRGEMTSIDIVELASGRATRCVAVRGAHG